jgi:hypothetical protein
MKNKLVIVTDLGLFKEYRVDLTPSQTPRLELLEEFMFVEAYRALRRNGHGHGRATRRADASGMGRTDDGWRFGCGRLCRLSDRSDDLPTAFAPYFFFLNWRKAIRPDETMTSHKRVSRGACGTALAREEPQRPTIVRFYGTGTRWTAAQPKFVTEKGETHDNCN